MSYILQGERMERFIEISNPTLFIKHLNIASTGPKCCAVNKLRTIDKTKEQKLKHIIHKVKKPYIFLKWNMCKHISL